MGFVANHVRGPRRSTLKQHPLVPVDLEPLLRLRVLIVGKIGGTKGSSEMQNWVLILPWPTDALFALDACPATSALSNVPWASRWILASNRVVKVQLDIKYLMDWLWPAGLWAACMLAWSEACIVKLPLHQTFVRKHIMARKSRCTFLLRAWDSGSSMKGNNDHSELIWGCVDVRTRWDFGLKQTK